MNVWSESSVWTGGGIRREVFFFPAAGGLLYGSFYSGVGATRPFGIVACGSWGVEGDRIDPLVRSAALAAARLGGAAVVFHYPGYGDSYGELAEVGLPDLRDAAVRAAEQASLRRPDVSWALAGFAFGAAVACLAAAPAAAEGLLLVQPALRPGAYFERLSRRTEPLAPGPSARDVLEARADARMAYGYPLPRRVVRHPREADAMVGSSLAAYGGPGALIAHGASSEFASAPERFERIDVPGHWRFGGQNHPGLAAAVVAWLARRAEVEC